MEKCKRTEKHRKMFTIGISSWRCSYSSTRLQLYRLESFGKSSLKPMTKTENFVPSAVPGLSSSSGASSSSTSLPQDSSTTSPSPAKLRSDDTHDQASGDRGDPPKIKNKKDNEDNNQATRNRFRGLPAWLEEITEVSRAVGKAESHFSKIQWNLANLVKTYRGIIELRHAEWKEEHLLYCRNLAWMKSGGMIPRKATAICKKFRTSWQTGMTIRRTT